MRHDGDQHRMLTVNRTQGRSLTLSNLKGKALAVHFLKSHLLNSIFSVEEWHFLELAFLAVELEQAQQRGLALPLGQRKSLSGASFELGNKPRRIETNRALGNQ